MSTPLWYHSGLSCPRNESRGALWHALIFILLGFSLVGQVLAKGLTAQIDRTQVVEGETINLHLSVLGDNQGSPDLRPLSADFDVLSQSQGSRINVINGRSSSMREWQLVLMPKHSGDLTIPALQLGGLKSQPLHLKVLPASASSTTTAGTNQPVVLEIETAPKDPYVQGEVTYKVRILSRVPLREASLSEPRAGDAIVERLGEDSHYTAQRNGTSYQVIERRYVIFPQHSGALEIEAPMLSAAVPVQGGRRQGLRGRFFRGDPFTDIEKFLGKDPFAGFPDLGGMFEETRPVRIRGRTVTLDVRPQPVGIQGPWLPAKHLTLAETWSPAPPVFRVGEPVTRTIALITEGLSAAQLPDLTPPVPAGMKIYPDQPHSETRAEGTDLIVTKTMKVALIPAAPGALTLPEFKIHWWDTETQQSRVAMLPARTIEVLPAAPGTNSPVVSNEPETVSPKTLGQTEAPPASSGSTGVAVQTPARQARWQAASYWPWLASGAALGWLITLLLWVRARTHRHTDANTPGLARSTAVSPRQRLAQSKTHLMNACLSNDPKAARVALLDWAKARWPEAPPRGLSALAARFATEASRREVVALDRLLYDAGARRAWDGRAAWPLLEQALKDMTPSDGRAEKAELLPALYPQHG